MSEVADLKKWIDRLQRHNTEMREFLEKHEHYIDCKDAAHLLAKLDRDVS